MKQSLTCPGRQLNTMKHTNRAHATSLRMDKAATGPTANNEQQPKSQQPVGTEMYLQHVGSQFLQDSDQEPAIRAGLSSTCYLLTSDKYKNFLAPLGRWEAETDTEQPWNAIGELMVDRNWREIIVDTSRSGSITGKNGSVDTNIRDE